LKLLYILKNNTLRGSKKFQISQHFRDAVLLKSFIEYFDCENYYLRSSQIEISEG